MTSNVADIFWNYKDTFIGTVSDWPTNVDSDDEGDASEGLIFDTFLAAPLLSTTGLYNERKFSGSDGIGENKDEVGLAIDAYAHHVFVDSHGTMILTDLQGIFLHISSCPLLYSWSMEKQGSLAPESLYAYSIRKPTRMF